MAPYSSVQSKLKVHLKLAISRLRIVQQKDTAIAKQQRREMAQLLEQGRYESARIRVENIIRSDLTTELLEILELYCELLLARIGLMEPHTCDPGLEEAVKSIIYAAPRTDVKELQQTRVLLIEKYGKDFGKVAIENSDGKVPERVLKKLRVEPPSEVLVESYLKAIAQAYDVQYGVESEEEEADEEEEEQDHDDDEPGSGGQAQKVAEEPLPADPTAAQPTPEQEPAKPPASPVAPKTTEPKSPISVAPPSPSTDNANPKIKLPPPPELKPTSKMKKQSEISGKPAKGSLNGEKSSGGSSKPLSAKIPEADDLEKRFAALRR